MKCFLVCFQILWQVTTICYIC